MNEMIVENIGSHMATGMAVYDSAGTQIGTVQQYDRTSGWLLTEKGVLFPRDRYIPFSAIDHIGPAGIYLNVTKEYVEDVYESPPPVGVDVVAGPAGARAVGTVTSGYDSSRVEVDSSTISAAIQRLDNGLTVYDSDGEKVGHVYQYEPGSEWIVVQQGRLVPKDLYIPVTAVAYLDDEGAHLRVTKDVLPHAFVVKPLAQQRSATDAPAQTRGTAPQPHLATKSDIDLTADVLAELAWDPAVSVADLNVSSANGLVTLSGTTATYLSRDAAETAAYRVSGVRSVSNYIMVDRAAVGQRSDEAIAADVRSALTLDTRIPLERVRVEVYDGTVTLSGQLTYHYQRQAAEDDAARIAGVTGVTNLIALRSPDAVATDVAHTIALAFARNAELADDNVSVRADGDTVTLSGTVRSWSEFNEAEAAAWRAAGVGKVVNDLRVTY